MLFDLGKGANGVHAGVCIDGRGNNCMFNVEENVIVWCSTGARCVVYGRGYGRGKGKRRVC